MDYFVMFADDEKYPPIVFDAASVEEAWDKVEKTYPEASVDNFEDIVFLVTDEEEDDGELDDCLWECNLDRDDKPYTKESFKRVTI